MQAVRYKTQTVGANNYVSATIKRNGAVAQFANLKNQQTGDSDMSGLNLGSSQREAKEQLNRSRNFKAAGPCFSGKTKLQGLR